MGTRVHRLGVTTAVLWVATLAGSAVFAQGRCALTPQAPGTSLAPLDERTRAAIAEALEDERRSEEQYLRAIETGAGRPFVPIARAERRHAELLMALFRHGGHASRGCEHRGSAGCGQ